MLVDITESGFICNFILWQQIFMICSFSCPIFNPEESIKYPSIVLNYTLHCIFLTQTVRSVTVTVTYHQMYCSRPYQKSSLIKELLQNWNTSKGKTLENLLKSLDKSLYSLSIATLSYFEGFFNSAKYDRNRYIVTSFSLFCFKINITRLFCGYWMAIQIKK